LIVELSHCIEHLLTILIGLIDHISRNLTDLILGAQRLVVVKIALHRNEIDRPAKLSFPPNRNLNGHGIGTQPIDNRLNTGIKVRANSIHLIHESDTRDFVLISLTPDSFRLRLDTLNGVKSGDRTIQHTQGPLDLDRKVYVTRRIDNIDTVFTPETRRSSSRDRNTTLTLLLHPIHGGGALMNLAHLMRHSRIVENSLCSRSLAGINVRHDADISCSL